MSELLEVTDLSVTISTPAGLLQPVQRVSVNVGSGEVVGVVGESGCGKSTLLKAVAGVLPRGASATGSLRVCGTQTPLGRSSHGVAMIFQDPMTSLNPVLSVGEQVAEVPRHRDGVSRSEARARAIELLSEVGIADAEQRLGAYPHQLSGGLRQRVVIAAALSGDPKLLLCDEPTTALDVTVQATFIRLLQRLVQSRDLGILYVTHDLPLLATMCDRIDVMYAGQVVERGSREQVLHAPAHPYTAALLRAAPRLEARMHSLPSIPGLPPRLLAPLPAGCRFAPRCPHAADECRGANELRPTTTSSTDPGTSDGHDTMCVRSDVLELERQS